MLFTSKSFHNLYYLSKPVAASSLPCDGSRRDQDQNLETLEKFAPATKRSAQEWRSHHRTEERKPHQEAEDHQEILSGPDCKDGEDAGGEGGPFGATGLGREEKGKTRGKKRCPAEYHVLNGQKLYGHGVHDCRRADSTSPSTFASPIASEKRRGRSSICLALRA